VSDHPNNQTPIKQNVNYRKRPRLPITYAELLNLKTVKCSCCGRDAQPGGASAVTGPGNIVRWVQCSPCADRCDHTHGTAIGTHCPMELDRNRSEWYTMS
jgi:hypothetical protein